MSCYLLLLLGIGPFPQSKASSNLLQSPLNNSAVSDLLNIKIPDADINILPTPSSLDSSWPATSAQANASSSNVTFHFPSVLPIKCDGRKYGFDLSISSCEEAFAIMPNSLTRLTGELP